MKIVVLVVLLLAQNGYSQPLSSALVAHHFYPVPVRIRNPIPALIERFSYYGFTVVGHLLLQPDLVSFLFKTQAIAQRFSSWYNSGFLSSLLFEGETTNFVELSLITDATLAQDLLRHYFYPAAVALTQEQSPLMFINYIRQQGFEIVGHLMPRWGDLILVFETPEMAYDFLAWFTRQNQ
ncbi:MAG: hypothetical protein WCK49_01810 [Myxococcaceae bacterium]